MPAAPPRKKTPPLGAVKAGSCGSAAPAAPAAQGPQKPDPEPAEVDVFEFTETHGRSGLLYASAGKLTIFFRILPSLRRRDSFRWQVFL